MWKGLKRWWGRGDEPSRPAGEDAAWARAAQAEPEPEPAPPHDPIVEALAAFDAAAAERGAEGSVPAMRDLILEAPTDARVMRRAAAVLRALGDTTLADRFDDAARSSQAEPLVTLADAFRDMDDPSLALALADGALMREPGFLAAISSGAEALAQMGRHAEALERLETISFRSVASDARLARRWSVSSVLAGDLDRYASIRDSLPVEASWIERAAFRATTFPLAPEAIPEARRQWLLYTLYGSVLLDDLESGERVDPARLGRWMHALAALVKGSLAADVRPAWVSPRGEVLARWLGSLLPVQAALPLSARLPKQPVIVVLADDQDLVTLWETKAWFDGTAAVFQAVKDPAEVGSPMADVIGAFRAGVRLPFEGLDAERAADREPPRMVQTRLEREAGKIDADDLEGFLAWVEARKEDLTLRDVPPPDGRVALTADAPPSTQ